MSPNKNVFYIHQLPHPERMELCCILDENDKWKELGSTHMQYDELTMQAVRRKAIIRRNSPSDELLMMWGHQYNHTVAELFILLYYIQQYEAMSTIRKYVAKKYHGLIDAGEQMPAMIEGPVEPISGLTVSDIVESAGAIPKISYEELQIATNNWDGNAILGKGGFGTVFKGTWNCTQVAIKRIEQKGGSPESYNEEIKQSVTELRCLNSYRHDNVLPIYGYSVGGQQPCLVYQYMAGGCLDKRLRLQDPLNVLNWLKRVNIATGTARGLQFLHTLGPLVHGDIKPANILLDPNDDAKIGDFGLAREGPRSNHTHVKVTKIQGTRPYVPDEYLRSKKLRTKVDTYSFGVVLFEIATALSAYSDQRKFKFLRDHVVHFEGDICALKDVKVVGGEDCFKRLIDIGKLCVGEKAKDRPEMRAVLMLLEGV